MREILFKAKRKYGKMWEYGSICMSRGRYYISEPEFSGQYQVLPDTICQYTGVDDKDGNKVFEGDIVEISNHRLCSVEYKTTPTFVGFELVAKDGDFKATDIPDVWSDIKVVGNVFDGVSKNDT